MTKTLGQVVGSNLRKRRGNISLDFLASQSPIPMSTGRVSNIETGRDTVTLPLLWAVAVALSRATMTPVSLADLLDGDNDDVTISGRLTVQLSDLRAAFTGQPVPVPVIDAETHRKGTAMVQQQNREFIRQTAEWKNVPARLRRNLDPGVFLRTLMTLREVDDRMCKNISVDTDTAAAAMARLWGQPFSAQRDLLAGPDANAQRRGQVSRTLKAQLVKEVKP